MTHSIKRRRNYNICENGLVRQAAKQLEWHTAATRWHTPAMQPQWHTAATRHTNQASTQLAMHTIKELELPTSLCVTREK